MAEQSFWDMLRTKRDSLTKSGIIVADYLMQHAEDAQYLSISSLAKACGVAEATIFRFCRALGFDGYNEMKIALAKATATAMPVSLKLEPGVDTQTLCTHAYNTAIEALNGTRSALDPGRWTARPRFCSGHGRYSFSGRAAAIYWPATSGRGSRCSPPSSARQATATCRPSPPA